MIERIFSLAPLSLSLKLDVVSLDSVEYHFQDGDFGLEWSNLIVMVGCYDCNLDQIG